LTRSGRGDLSGAARWLHDGLTHARVLQSLPTQLVALEYCAEWLAASGERARAAALWTFVASGPSAERGDGEDAREFVTRLQLSGEEVDAAKRSASTFELDRLVDSLLADFMR